MPRSAPALRGSAERQDTGSDGMYRITFTAADGQGGSCSGAGTVSGLLSMKGGGC